MASIPLSDNAAAILALFDERERLEFCAQHGTPPEDPAGQHKASDLLRWIIVQRTPFIQMASKIVAMLNRIEASIKGNIDFVILPTEDEDLELSFGPQIRRLIETAGRWSQDGRYRDLTAQARDLRQSIRRFCDECRSEPIERDTDIGALIKTLPELDPRRIAAEHFPYPPFVDTDHEYSPEDVRALGTAHARLSELLALAKTTEGLTEAARMTLKVAGVQLADKHSRARARQSREAPFARPSLQRRRVDALLGSIAELQRSIELEREIGDDHPLLIQAMALSLWKQRWRLYELWLFCHVCDGLCGVSRGFDTAGRVADGRWTLKFTKDDKPVLRCRFENHGLDVYYQYHEEGADRANMPDIAVRITPSSEWLLILDPKAGETFTRPQLAEVCTRYADAFRPQLSAVANYFPQDYRADPLPRQPPAILYHGLRPDSVGDLDAAVRQSLERAAILRMRAIILFDVSESTAQAHARLDRALRAWLAREPDLDDAGSAILVFADRVIERIGLPDYLARGRSWNPSGSTNLAGAFQEALTAFGAESGGGEIWLVSDGEEDVDPATWGEAFREKGIRLRALIAGSMVKPGIAALCAGSGGDCNMV